VIDENGVDRVRMSDLGIRYLGEGDGSASACGSAQRTQAAGRQERRSVSCVDPV